MMTPEAIQLKDGEDPALVYGLLSAGRARPKGCRCADGAPPGRAGSGPCGHAADAGRDGSARRPSR
eukprot:scaffold347105_cov18-Prasinocladus_malaysianus.AAC.1